MVSASYPGDRASPRSAGDAKKGQVILFASHASQEKLLTLAGDSRRSVGGGLSRLVRTGLVTQVSGLGDAYSLDYRHPGFDALWETLAHLGTPRFSRDVFGLPANGMTIDRERPLGHGNPYAFRVLFHLTHADGVLETSALRAQMPDASIADIRRAVDQLAGDCLDLESNVLRFRADVPAAFRQLVRDTAAYLSIMDERYRLPGRRGAERRPAAFTSNDDGAPLLFGSDTRLRHLMAIAREGVIHLSDLRRITGVERVALESRDRAPFGRAAMVRIWDTHHGPAAMIDPDFPLAHELRMLLLKLQETYPLSPSIRRLPTPTPPPERRTWKGDVHALFGAQIATDILMTIAAIGWAFESLCVAALPGYDRVSVKNVLRRLGEEGIISSDRGHRPGFDVRIVRLSPAFSAYGELATLLARGVAVWPEFSARALSAVARLNHRTKVQLRKRGLLTKDFKVAKRSSTDRFQHAAEIREQTLAEYASLTKAHGRALSAHQLMKLNSNLYRRILAHWGGMDRFRADADVPLAETGTKSRPGAFLRDRCVREYHDLATKIGENPNVSALRRSGTGLYERIVIAWGSFPAFWSAVYPSLPRRRRDPRRGTAAKKAECIAEYRFLAAEIGYAPKGSELGTGLRKRICKTWGSFGAFITETDIEPAHSVHKFASNAARRAYCLELYADLTSRLGHAPSSFEIQRDLPHLYGQIKTAWGGFVEFCNQTKVRLARITRTSRRSGSGRSRTTKADMGSRAERSGHAHG